MGLSDESRLEMKRFSKTSAIDRVIGDLRRGAPVIVADKGFAASDVAGGAAIIIAGELMDGPALEVISGASAKGPAPVLAVTPSRAEALKVPSKGREVVCLRIAQDSSAADIVALADPTQDLGHPLGGPYVAQDDLTEPQTLISAAALALCREAGLLPAACILFLDLEDPQSWAAERNFLIAEANEIAAQLDRRQGRLRQAASANLPLAVAENTRIVAFRADRGSTEHFALIIGAPNTHDPVLTRVHSACFTGDLLGSLKCDCGTQLQSALQVIAKEGSGILLYMDQEGRGIGLLAKLKAYALQDQGFDTVDANLRLGFQVDERSFAPAAEILKALGFDTVRLLTNNPDKVAGLEVEGIRVSERVEHSFPPNRHNEAYLATKKNRTGHLL